MKPEVSTPGAMLQLDAETPIMHSRVAPSILTPAWVNPCEPLMTAPATTQSLQPLIHSPWAIATPPPDEKEMFPPPPARIWIAVWLASIDGLLMQKPLL